MRFLVSVILIVGLFAGAYFFCARSL